MHRRISVNFWAALIWVVIGLTDAEAGHSRSGYLDAGRSVDGRYQVTAQRSDTLDKKGRLEDYRWEYLWKDNQSGESVKGELVGLRSGLDNVFDPVNSHIFVAPDGQSFAVWTPQAMARSENKNPTGERSDDSYRSFPGFDHRLTIYRNTGEIIHQAAINDYFGDADWDWFFYHQRQLYWLAEYEGLTNKSAPRSGYALFKISPDRTVIEFQIGTTPEGVHKAKARGITPPEPRIVRVRLTDGKVITGEKLTDPQKIPVRPFIGELANKDHPQRDYVAAWDPLSEPGKFTSTEPNDILIKKGQSSPQ